MINVFQEQLVTGQKTASSQSSEEKERGGSSSTEPMVNLVHVNTFEEYFYLVVVEKTASGTSVLHMWRIKLSAQGMPQPVLPPQQHKPPPQPEVVVPAEPPERPPPPQAKKPPPRPPPPLPIFSISHLGFFCLSCPHPRLTERSH